MLHLLCILQAMSYGIIGQPNGLPDQIGKQLRFNIPESYIQEDNEDQGLNQLLYDYFEEDEKH